MAARILPAARDDLREAIRYYRNVNPPALGKRLAVRVLAAFREAVSLVQSMPRTRPEHPDIPGARYVILAGFPYVVFYTVKESDIIVVAVEYATRDYVERVSKRSAGSE